MNAKKRLREYRIRNNPLNSELEFVMVESGCYFHTKEEHSKFTDTDIYPFKFSTFFKSRNW